MKKNILVVLLLSFTCSFVARGQTEIYSTFGWEIPFQFASINYYENETGNVMRFAPVINFQFIGNIDFGKAAGLFTGIGVRNVGFIHNQPDNSVKKKFRNYNLAIPLGVKLGNMKGFFLYGGYEIEFPFHYKEKTFVNEVKNEIKTGWFVSQVPSFYNTAFVGIQFKYGFNIKFKYYFTNFFNKDYTENLDGEVTKPFEFYEANILYFSLNFSLFRNAKFYYKTTNIEHKF